MTRVSPVPRGSSLGERLAVCLLALQVVASEIDVSGLGAPESVATVFKWGVQAPLFVVPIVLIGVRSNVVRIGVVSLPQGAAYAWLIWGVCTALWAPDVVGGLQVSLSVIGLWTTAAWFVWVFGFARFARVFTMTATGFLAVGLVHDLLTGGRTVAPGDTFESAGRMAGLSFGPTNLGRFALITVVLAAVMLVLHSRRDWVFRIGAGVGTITLLLTGTRTSLVVLTICLLALALRVLGPARTAFLGVGVVGAVAVVILSLPDPVDVLSRSGGAGEITSFNGRWEVWQLSANIIAERPIIGHGVRSEAHLFDLAASRGELPWQSPHAHQMVLDVVMTRGFIGLALLALALGGYLSAGRRHRGVASIVVLAIMLNGTTEALLHRPTSTFLILSAALAERVVVPRLRSGTTAVRHQLILPTAQSWPRNYLPGRGGWRRHELLRRRPVHRRADVGGL